MFKISDKVQLERKPHEKGEIILIEGSTIFVLFDGHDQPHCCGVDGLELQTEEEVSYV
jgi:hypothetical protein